MQPAAADAGQSTSSSGRRRPGDNPTRPTSPADLRALPPTIDVQTAARILGIGRALAYRLVQRDEFPCRVLQVGKRYLIPRNDLLRALGVIDPATAEPTTTAGQASAGSPTPTT